MRTFYEFFFKLPKIREILRIVECFHEFFHFLNEHMYPWHNEITKLATILLDQQWDFRKFTAWIIINTINSHRFIKYFFYWVKICGKFVVIPTWHRVCKGRKHSQHGTTWFVTTSMASFFFISDTGTRTTHGFFDAKREL